MAQFHVLRTLKVRVYNCLSSRNLCEFLVGRKGRFYISDNCPSWWPKDVAFSSMTGMVRSAQPNSRYDLG